MAYDGEKAGGVAAKPGSGAQLSMLMGESDPNMTFSEDDAKEAKNLYSEYGGFGLQRSVSINDKQVVSHHSTFGHILRVAQRVGARGRSCAVGWAGPLHDLTCTDVVDVFVGAGQAKE